MKKKKKDGRVWYDFDFENADLPPPLPPAIFQHASAYPTPPVFVVEAGKEPAEQLTDLYALQKDAGHRFQDGGIEGMLKSALTKSALREMGIDSSYRTPFPYLESYINDFVNGNYLKDYNRHLERDGENGRPGYQLPIVKFLRQNVPASQRKQFLKYGVYVDPGDGVVYHGISGRPVADLKTSYAAPKGPAK